MRITHVVVTDAFAGTERYVAEVARRQAERGHDVRVLGGHPPSMVDLVGSAQWRPAASVPRACARLIAGGRRDVVHTHLTYAEAAAVLSKPAHRAVVVTTRHIAGRRGTSAFGAAAAPVIARAVDIELAISDRVASAIGSSPFAVLRNGVPCTSTAYASASRTVLVLQRLSPEKDTATALRAWRDSGLEETGWRLIIAGEGAQRSALEELALQLGLSAVQFHGHVADVGSLLGRATILLATAPDEPLGLSVLEAMAHGVPVVAAGAGGHLETLPAEWPWLFPPGDARAAGAALRDLAASPRRTAASEAVRVRQAEHFDVEHHVTSLLQVYASRPAARRGPRR